MYILYIKAINNNDNLILTLTFRLNILTIPKVAYRID